VEPGREGRCSFSVMQRSFLALAIALTACTSDSETLRGARAGGLVPENPCSLVTTTDVEIATDSQVITSGLVPDEQQLRPQDPNPCQYETDGRHASIDIYVHPHGAADFARLQDRDPRNTESIQGVGDEAFAHGLAALYVRIDDGYFLLVTQHGAGWPGIRNLKDLALAALD
jgi:hypothetical protein